ncbi:MAG: tetratricopeptide repeat protein [Thermodesulfovibrionales bacterium]|jgi:YaiO family outer membrane protein
MRVILVMFVVMPAFIAPVYGEEVSDYDVGIDLIRCYRNSGDFEKAEILLTLMLREQSANEKILSNDSMIDAIQCYLREGKAGKAETLLNAVLPQYPDNLLSYDTGIDAVKQYIKDEQFQKAEVTLKGMLQRYPDNIELLTMLARILFWQKRYDESLDEYAKALNLQEDEAVKGERAKVEAAKMISEVNALLEKGETNQAKAMLISLFESKREQYNSGYQLGMLYIKEREYDKAVEIFRQLMILFPEDRGFAALYVESLILNGDISKAGEALNALPDDFKAYLSREREDLFYRVRRNYFNITGTFVDYSGNYKNERDASLELSQRIRELTFVLNTLYASRFGLHDSQISLDVYSKLGEMTKRWGYISLSVSPDAQFLPKTAFGGEIYQGYGKSEISLGYKRMNFSDTSIDMFFPGVIFYLPSSFALNEKIYMIPQNSTFSLVSTLNYEPNYRIRSLCSLAAGNAADRFGSVQDVQKYTTVASRLRTEYRFVPSVSVGAEISYEYRAHLYSTYGGTLFSSYWW